MAVEFCHIAPTKHLDLVSKRTAHLCLAHLVETDDRYCEFYINEKKRHNSTIILDNSAFELYKQGRPMYPSEKLIGMGEKIGADYIVMSDYPNEPGEKTIQAAYNLAADFHDSGFKTFFVPQSRIGDIEDYINTFKWAANNPKIVDYIGVSILGVPNAFGVEKNNKLQRFTARQRMMYMLKERGTIDTAKHNGQKIHFLGLVDGPNEIIFCNQFAKYIDTWDSSQAIWHGFNNIIFDQSPTGLINGKLEKEVDFDFETSDQSLIDNAKFNIRYIDRICYSYIWG